MPTSTTTAATSSSAGGSSRVVGGRCGRSTPSTLFHMSSTRMNREIPGMTELESKLGSAAKLAGQGKVSRRDFIQLALAAGLTVTAANAMFVRAVRAEPKKGGTLKI